MWVVPRGAVYAVLDFGLRALIGPSFGDIFAANCLQNGVLPIVLDYPAIHNLWRQIEAEPGVMITIDLPQQTVVSPDGMTYGFEINPLRKERMIRGADDIDVTLQHGAAIEAFERERQSRFFWLPRATREQPDAP